MSGRMFIVAATVAQGFWRCGRHWTKEGVLVDAAEFTEEQWKRITSEAKLRVKEASDEDTAQADARTDRIAEAIKSLTPDDFQQNGKPKVDALNALLADELETKITAPERDTIWGLLIDEGFETPKADE